MTLEPNTYGPSAQIKMKIVETLVPKSDDISTNEDKTGIF